MEDTERLGQPGGAGEHHSGYVALLGRPNVGKSTLLNHLIGQKLSITSPRPQTTRYQVLGILSRPDAQILFLDTPGVHQGYRRLNRQLLRAAKGALEFADVGVLVVEALHWGSEDAEALSWLAAAGIPLVAVVNKVDRVKDKGRLLPFLADLAARHPFAAVVPMSAKSPADVARLAAVLAPLLPLGPPIFPPDQLTDRPLRFLAAELIREQLFRQLGEELPYETAVAVESYREEDGRQRVEATIYCRRPGQKAILIGKGGERLKRIGEMSRKALEELSGAPVYLGLWVKVREDWPEDPAILRELGYDER